MEFTQEEIADHRREFELLDLNGDGKITKNEVCNIFKIQPDICNGNNVKLLMTTIDTDKNGTIDFDEYMTFVKYAERRLTREEETRFIFNMVDADGNGYITAREFRQFANLMNQQLTRREAREMILDGDADGDGRISFEEFKAALDDD